MSRLCRLGVLPKLGLNELWWRIHNGGERGWGVVCGDAAQKGEVKDGGVRECEQDLVNCGV